MKIKTMSIVWGLFALVLFNQFRKDYAIAQTTPTANDKAIVLHDSPVMDSAVHKTIDSVITAKEDAKILILKMEDKVALLKEQQRLIRESSRKIDSIHHSGFASK